MAEKITKEIIEKLNEHLKNSIEVCGLNVTIGEDEISVHCYENQFGMALATLITEKDLRKTKDKVNEILGEAAEKLSFIFSNKNSNMKCYSLDASNQDDDE